MLSEGGLVLGIALLVTWAFSVAAIVQPNHVIKPLVILNWLLVADAIIILCVGTFIWFFSVQQREEFHAILSVQSNETIIAIQDRFSCCGYFNATDLLVIGGSFCANQTFVDTTVNSTEAFCVTPFTHATDYTLENTFSSIYGFMAPTILLFFATLCIISVVSDIHRSLLHFMMLMTFFYSARMRSASRRSMRNVVAVVSSKRVLCRWDHGNQATSRVTSNRPPSLTSIVPNLCSIQFRKKSYQCLS